MCGQGMEKGNTKKLLVQSEVVVTGRSLKQNLAKFARIENCWQKNLARNLDILGPSLVSSAKFMGEFLSTDSKNSKEKPAPILQ
jgi:hypothetical protein